MMPMQPRVRPAAGYKMADFDVLLEIDGSKRVLRVNADTVLVSVESELGKLGKDISLLPLGAGKEELEGRTKPTYVLQRWVTRFESFVDVTDKSQVCDGDRLTVTRVSSGSAASSQVGVLVGLRWYPELTGSWWTPLFCTLL